VDLVDDQDGPSPAPPGARDDLLEVGQPLGDGADGLDVGAAGRRDQACQGRLAGPRRAPEDQRAGPPRVDHSTQGPPGRQEPLLPQDLVERPRPHPGRERGLGIIRPGEQRRLGRQPIDHASILRPVPLQRA
jgi:hypothetical protein